MTTHRPTPMDRAPSDPSAPLLGPGQWHVPAPVFRKGEAPHPTPPGPRPRDTMAS